jgi:predicted phage-related endonuclease
MRNVFAALRPARVRPNLKLVPAPVTDRPIILLVALGIEASEAAVAIGIDPHQSQFDLWRDKTLQLAHTGKPPECQDPKPGTDTSASYWHKLLEPLVASVYTKRTGNALRRSSVTACHPQYPWMQARVGWEVVGCPDADLMRYVNVGPHEASDWKEGLPLHQRVNALHLLAVTGKQAVDLAVLLCGQELHIHRVERDEDLIERVMQLQRRFWRCVERNEPPPSDGRNTQPQAVGADHGPA